MYTYELDVQFDHIVLHIHPGMEKVALQQNWKILDVGVIGPFVGDG